MNSETMAEAKRHGGGEDAPRDAGREGRDGVHSAPVPGSSSVQVVGTRMARHAWRAVREIGARVLHDALAERRGSAAEWARRLGIDASRIADWTGLDLTKSPTIADVLLMERDDALRFLRALVKRLDGSDALDPGDPLALAHEGVLTAADGLRVVMAAVADGHICGAERAAIKAVADKLRGIVDRLDALAKGGR